MKKSVLNLDRSADWLTEQFCIISFKIIQRCDVQKSNSENLSIPSLEIFRLCSICLSNAQCFMVKRKSISGSLVLSAVRRFLSICRPDQSLIFNGATRPHVCMRTYQQFISTHLALMHNQVKKLFSFEFKATFGGPEQDQTSEGT